MEGYTKSLNALNTIQSKEKGIDANPKRLSQYTLAITLAKWRLVVA